MQDIGLHGNQSQQNSLLCVAGVGEGVELDPYLYMVYQSGFYPGFMLHINFNE